jgi:RecJ-like exonuclease
MPARRLEDRIRELCAKVSVAPETELDAALSELKSALHEHSVRLRKMAAENFAKRKPGDKRSH